MLAMIAGTVVKSPRTSPHNLRLLSLHFPRYQQPSSHHSQRFPRRFHPHSQRFSRRFHPQSAVPSEISSLQSAVPSAISSLQSAVPSAISSQLSIRLDNIQLDDVDIQVTFDQSWPTVSFSKSAFGPYLTVTAMRPDGHYGFQAIAHAILKCQDDWNDIRTSLLNHLESYGEDDANPYVLLQLGLSLES